MSKKASSKRKLEIDAPQSRGKTSTPAEQQQPQKKQHEKQQKEQEKYDEAEDEEEIARFATLRTKDDAYFQKYDNNTVSAPVAVDVLLCEECEAARYVVALWCAALFAPNKPRIRADECFVRDAMRERFVAAIDQSVAQHIREKKLNPDTQSSLLDSKFHAAVIERVLFWRWYYLHPAMYRQRCRQLEYNLAHNGWYMLTHFGPLTVCAFPTRKLAENTDVDEWRSEHRARLLHDLKPPTPKIDEKGTFQCGKCKSWRTSYYPMQTRGGDEPMTNFVTCHDCDNHFRRS